MHQADDIRREIEEIDRELHGLLVRRTALSETLWATHQEHASVAGRAARTAAILRGILSRHQGSFPKRALVRIWSDILQPASGGTTLHVFAGENAEGYWDLARAHFSCMIPMVAHSTTAAVVHACADDAGALGIVPMPDSVESGQAWWDQLAPAGSQGPRFVQCLPFVADEEDGPSLPEGYAIGTVEQTPTGSDTTILRLECHSELSRTRLQTLLRQAGFEAKIMAASRQSMRSSASSILIANKGFVATDDARLALLAAKAGDALESISHIGGFANPFPAGAERFAS